MSAALELISRKFGIEAFEYDRPGDQILIAAGTGLMLSIMDQCPGIRWCLDVDPLTADQKAKLGDWLVCVGNVMERVIVAGWFSSTNPKPLAEAVGRLRRARTLCYVQFHGVGADPFVELRTAGTLAELLDQIRAPAQGEPL